MLNRDGARGLIVGLLLGGVLGFFLANRSRGDAVVSTTAAAPAQQRSLDGQSRLFAAEQVVLKDPKNVEAWITLGNGYFDEHKPQQAVDAYAKALELKPDNPDVLTDQGVMYRELKAYDKAIANWQRAQKLDAGHRQSLYNLGVVYAYDLKMPDKARKAWTKLIALAPGSPNALQAQDGLAKLKGN